MKSAVDKQERNCFFSSDDSCRLTASPLLIILCFRVCVCVCVACTDTELHSLAARLKDWFGVLHLDANRDLKSSDSFDSATGREYIPHTSVCVCVHACAHVYVQPFFCWAATLFSPHDGCRWCWQRPCSVQGIWTHLSSDTHTRTHAHTHIYTHTHYHSNQSDLDIFCRFKSAHSSDFFQSCVFFPSWSHLSSRLWHQHLAHL